MKLYPFKSGLLPVKKIRQALDILTMNYQELAGYIKEQVYLTQTANNKKDKLYCKTQRKITKREYIKYWDQYVNFEDDFYDYKYDWYMNREFLKEYLLFQLHTAILSESEIQIGEYIINNIDDNGYLMENIREVSRYNKTNIRKVKKVLDIIQTFDPPGICARNLKECLLIQLKQGGNIDVEITNAVKKHLTDIAYLKVEELASKLKISVVKAKSILNTVKKLEPKPGRYFYNDDRTKYVIPDVIVKIKNTNFEVDVNDREIPFPDINDNLINSQNYSFLWLIICIENRKHILEMITEYILQKNEEFFSSGEKKIYPVSLENAEKDLGISKSIINRTICDKYLECKWGIYRIKSFFGNGLAINC